MEKRSLLAISLSALVILVYYVFVFKPPPPASPTPPSSSPPTTATTKPSASEGKDANLLKLAPDVAAQPQIPPKINTVDTPLYRAETLNLGAVGKSFSVKGYQQTTEKNSPLVDLFAGTLNQNLLLQFHDANFSLPDSLSFEVAEEGSDFVSYRFKNSDIVLTKHIHWDTTNYVANVKVTLENTSSQTLQAALGLRLDAVQHPPQKGGWGFLKAPENFIHPLSFQDNGMTRHNDIKKLAPQMEETGAFRWVGLEDRYFLWALISRALSSETRSQYGVKEGNQLFSELIYPKEVVAPAGKIEKEFTVYVGPKDIDHLKQLGVHLEKAVDYGWFSFVAQPILFLLKFFHRWVGNWGVAIILLTVFIKLVLHPINKKTLESMKAMQKLQPKLTEIREKYKNDKERMNVEMMNLFKTHKVNPMGGCLPMLLQMPVYIALYKVLYNAIELYHAPFFGFYKDLSAPDPYFISPILLGIFMVLQQKMTPSATQDPAQANAMLFMPIMFSAFMLFLPSGLVLYIFVNTFMTVVQQYMHQHDMSFSDLFGRRKAS
ncbi:MAG: membrane protein insertase YidC [bacterium]